MIVFFICVGFFIGKVFFNGKEEKDDRGTENAGFIQDLHVQNMGKSHQQKDEHLAADAFEADGGTELLVWYSAHDAGNVVNRDKDDQRIEQAVAAAEEVAQPCAQAEKRGLNESPEFFQYITLLKVLVSRITIAVMRQ